MTNKQYRNYKDIPTPKPGEIIVVPNDDRLMENPPFVNGSNALPDWFKRIPKTKGSIRRCAGTIDYLSLGVTVPFWSNMYFEPDMNARGRWRIMIENYPEGRPFSNEPFPYESTGRCPMTEAREIEDAYYPKIVNPYHFKTAPGWSTIVLPPLFEPNQHYSVVPSIVHTDVYHTMNVVLNITAASPFSVKYGTPIMHLIPFKRNSDFSKITALPMDAYRAIIGRGFGDAPSMPHESTAGPYRRFVKQTDSRLEEAEKQKRKLHLPWRRNDD